MTAINCWKEHYFPGPRYVRPRFHSVKTRGWNSILEGFSVLKFVFCWYPRHRLCTNWELERQGYALISAHRTFNLVIFTGYIYRLKLISCFFSANRVQLTYLKARFEIHPCRIFNIRVSVSKMLPYEDWFFQFLDWQSANHWQPIAHQLS